jgi:hypothetical protein
VGTTLQLSPPVLELLALVDYLKLVTLLSLVEVDPAVIPLLVVHTQRVVVVVVDLDLQSQVKPLVAGHPQNLCLCSQGGLTTR